MSNSRYTEQQRNTVLDEYVAGRAVGDIAADIGCSVQWVRLVLHQADVHRLPHRRPHRSQRCVTTRPERAARIANHLRRFQESGALVRSINGTPIGISIPAGHPRWAEVVRLLGAADVEMVERVESVRGWLSVNFLSVRPSAGQTIDIRGLQHHHDTWRAAQGYPPMPMTDAQFRAALASNSVGISDRNKASGIIAMSEALSDTLVGEIQ